MPASEGSYWGLSVRFSSIVQDWGDFLPLRSALRIYGVKTKPNIQRWEGIRGGNKVHAPEENYWRLSVRSATADPP